MRVHPDGERTCWYCAAMAPGRSAQNWRSISVLRERSAAPAAATAAAWPGCTRYRRPAPQSCLPTPAARCSAASVAVRLQAHQADASITITHVGSTSACVQTERCDRPCAPANAHRLCSQGDEGLGTREQGSFGVWVGTWTCLPSKTTRFTVFHSLPNITSPAKGECRGWLPAGARPGVGALRWPVRLGSIAGACCSSKERRCRWSAGAPRSKLSAAIALATSDMFNPPSALPTPARTKHVCMHA